jgi:DNA-directed RNA polymerase specialized sigma24 family protein
MSDELPPPKSVTLAIRKVRAGDHDAFEILVGVYQRRILSIAHRVLGRERLSNEMAGADVTQSVFLQLWRGLSGGQTWFVEAVTDREALLKVLERLTWLRASKAVRHSLAACRRGTVRDADITLPSDIRHSATFVDDDPDNVPDLVAESRILVEEAEKTLRRTAPDPASANELAAIFRDLLNEVSTADTADRLNLSRRTVQRKRDLVRSILDDWLGTEIDRFDSDDSA